MERPGTVWMQFPSVRPLIEHAAERRYLDGEVAVLDDGSGPDGGDDLVL